MLLAEGVELGRELARAGVGRGEEVVEEGVPLIGRQVGRILREGFAESVRSGKLRGFEPSEGTVKDLELVHLAALEAGVAEAVADGEVGLGAAVGDVFREAVAEDFEFGAGAVDVDADTGRAAGAVVGDGEVGPAVDRDR